MKPKEIAIQELQDMIAHYSFSKLSEKKRLAIGRVCKDAIQSIEGIKGESDIGEIILDMTILTVAISQVDTIVFQPEPKFKGGITSLRVVDPLNPGESVINPKHIKRIK